MGGRARRELATVEGRGSRQGIKTSLFGKVAGGTDRVAQVIGDCRGGFGHGPESGLSFPRIRNQCRHPSLRRCRADIETAGKERKNHAWQFRILEYMSYASISLNNHEFEHRQLLPISVGGPRCPPTAKTRYESDSLLHQS